MASIQEYLDLIKNAIYGKDVRQAIHDGIQQCYYDGKAGSTDLQARQRLDSAEVSINSLGSRMSTAETNIDELDARVDQIVAPSGEAPSAAEVADGRIVDGITYNLIGDAIRAINTNLKNNISNVDIVALGAPNYTEGKYIKNDGSFMSDPNYSVTDLIEVPSGTEVRFWYGAYNATGIKLIEYDSSENVIGYWGGLSSGGSRNITLNASTTHVRFSFAKGYPARLSNTAETVVYYTATKANGAIEESREGLEYLSGKILLSEFDWIDNSYVKPNGVIEAYSGWHRTDYIDIENASKIYLYATSSSNTQMYNSWYDKDKNWLGNFLCNSSETEYTPPSNAKYFVLSTSNSNSVQQGKMIYSLDKLSSNIGFDTGAVSVLNSITSNIVKSAFSWIDGSYVKLNGEIDSDETWHRTDYIDIEGAEKVYLYATSGSSTQLYNCWYDENKNFISNFLCNSTIIEHTPPVNAKYYILSTSKTNTVLRGIKDTSVNAIKSSLGIVNQKPAFTYRGSLVENGSYDTHIGLAPKIGFKCGLFAKVVGTFSRVIIQLDAYSPNQIVVDANNVTLRYRYATDVVLPHGVTIDGDIYISAVMDNPSTIKVTVSSKGVQNTVVGSFSITAYETLKILNGGQALTDIVLTVGCTTINKPIWVIGDSYLGMTNPARWPYYLYQNGFIKSNMLCGSTGSGVTESNTWLETLLSMSTPQRIIWCMGMNYSPDGSAPAAGWLYQLQTVQSICDANGIELILATIPSVPNRSNEQKNAYVRSSGLRYIDFAKAVGAQSDGTWYTGMLSNDNVHPSETGAIALYNMAIASIPELTYDYE